MVDSAEIDCSPSTVDSWESDRPVLSANLLAARQDSQFLHAFTKESPLVTVCVATSDRPQLLISRCVASLLRQSYTNLQIVVVGDCCAAETGQALAAISDSRLQYTNLPERGPYPRPGYQRWCVAGTNAINHALSLAEGDFICHLDDDDESLPNRIERLVACAQRTHAELIWHKFFHQTTDGLWQVRGRDVLRLSEVTTGSIFVHQFFAQITWDIQAYRTETPGDWHRIGRLLGLKPKLAFLPEVLLVHYQEQNQERFEALPNERFL